VIKDAAGQLSEVHCTYDPETRSGLSGAERKVKGTIHWVSAAHALPAEVRLYDRLFSVPRPDAGEQDFKTFLNPASLQVLAGCQLEPALRTLEPGTVLQFERLGYFVADMIEHGSARPVYNRIVTLRDSWAKLEGDATL
jgi:glutaminyl-tRNA synthetase